MIGVIGPEDSVQLALRVATADDLKEQVVGRAYSDLGEALELARDLDQLCRVLLFTGAAPYALVREDDGWRSVLEYVPHSTVDLYRTLVRVLGDHGGELPGLSLDTIEAAEVDQAFEDLGLPVPAHVIPLWDAEDAVRAPESIAEAHADLFERGKVSCCLTCLGSVHRALSERGVPCYRVEHTQSSMRESLRRAALSSMLARSEATQMAIALVEIPALEPRTAGEDALYEAQRLRLRVQSSLLDYAEDLRGTLAPLDERTFIVHTTRGPVEDALHRFRQGHVSPIEPRELPRPATVGYGLGFSVADAEENARRALRLARRKGVTHIVFSDGTTSEVREQSTPERPELVPSDELGLGQLALSRLLAALRRLDVADVTPRDLATAYGVTPRSARRLLARLQDAGVATETSQQPSTGRGRPRKRYRIDSARLMALAERDPETT